MARAWFFLVLLNSSSFSATRLSISCAMESLGASIETEQRAKGEGLRIKKQLEGEINELEIGLDHA